VNFTLVSLEGLETNKKLMKKYYASLTLLLSIAFIFPLGTSALALPRAIVQTPIVSCVNGSTQVKLSWSPLSGATSYSIFRNKASTTWTNVSSKQLATVFTDTNIVSGSYQYQVKAYFGTGASYSNIVSVAVPSCSTTTPPSTSGETKFSAYITGYGWPDNTPASAEISDGVIHSSAGGTGAFADPITIAVGHSIISGKDILDYPKGTKFYIPALKRYFIVEDTCGDGDSPQDGPCHTGFQGHIWLDAWVGGAGANSSSVLACEDKITDFHTVIQNPTSSYVVVTGPIFNSVCSSLFSETPTTN
jgi:hypothetical protein